MKDDQGYNGWANYETWACNLWLDEYGMREEFAKMRLSNYDLQKEIKNWMEEENPLGDQASVYSDLLGAAISAIDFREIANSIMDDEYDEEED